MISLQWNVSCFFQMVLVAIFSETGFFDYCAVKVSEDCNDGVLV